MSRGNEIEDYQGSCQSCDSISTLIIIPVDYMKVAKESQVGIRSNVISNGNESESQQTDEQFKPNNADKRGNQRLHS